MKAGPTPRRRKPSAASRVRRFWIVALAIVLFLGAAAAGAALWPGFYPREIAISGNRVVTRLEIVERAGVLPNVNMWLQNPRAIAARVEAIPYVLSASVHRLPPATIAIAIAEREPYATLRSGTRWALVDRDLRVLETAAGPLAALPELDAVPDLALAPGTSLSDTDTVALRDDYDAIAAAHVDAASVGRDKFGGLEATLRDGVELKLGSEEDLPRKLALVGPILTQVGHGGRELASIDLRAPSTPVVVYR